MASKYDENGKFLGEIVENLTDGPTHELDKGTPYGVLGDTVYASRAIDEFQRMIWNISPYWGLRKVWHKVFGTVEQALLRNALGELQWTNVERTR